MKNVTEVVLYAERRVRKCVFPPFLANFPHRHTFEEITASLRQALMTHMPMHTLGDRSQRPSLLTLVQLHHRNCRYRMHLRAAMSATRYSFAPGWAKTMWLGARKRSKPTQASRLASPSQCDTSALTCRWSAVTVFVPLVRLTGCALSWAAVIVPTTTQKLSNRNCQSIKKTKQAGAPGAREHVADQGGRQQHGT